VINYVNAQKIIKIHRGNIIGLNYLFKNKHFELLGKMDEKIKILSQPKIQCLS
jgi:hypothetical protein